MKIFEIRYKRTICVPKFETNKAVDIILTVFALNHEMLYSRPNMVPVCYVDFQETHFSSTDTWLFPI